MRMAGVMTLGTVKSLQDWAIRSQVAQGTPLARPRGGPTGACHAVKRLDVGGLGGAPLGGGDGGGVGGAAAMRPNPPPLSSPPRPPRA